MDPIAPFGIGICGIEELDGHCEAGVSHVLSILDPEWPVPESFGRFGEHRKLELRFHDVIEEMPGMVRPEREDVEQILAVGAGLLAEPGGRPEARVKKRWPAGPIASAGVQGRSCWPRGRRRE